MQDKARARNYAVTTFMIYTRHHSQDHLRFSQETLTITIASPLLEIVRRDATARGMTLEQRIEQLVEPAHCARIGDSARDKNTELDRIARS